MGHFVWCRRAKGFFEPWYERGHVCGRKMDGEEMDKRLLTCMLYGIITCY